MKKSIFILNLLIIIFCSCKQQETIPIIKKTIIEQPKTISYKLENAKEWFAKTSDSVHLAIALAVNRTDRTNFVKMDSVIIPQDLTEEIAYYLPFPVEVPYLNAVKKIIYFSYPTQTFATYENGILVHTGQTNMGRKKDPTATGLFFTNWKAEETTSTFNDEWELRWNFNIANKLGIGWHQYDLPGYPASHSCLRLQEKDAQYLYEWADQWVLKDEETVLVKGTPVIVFGNYDFDSPKPWLQLVANPKALDISETEIEKQTQPYLSSILFEQKNRTKVQSSE